MRADWSDYPSPSEAFFGLLGMLTCRTHDVDQIERVVRRSGLEAEKWDQPRGDSTWLRRDVEKNLANALRVAPGSDA
jgi:primase-polymerase (primpol)-like protein